MAHHMTHVVPCSAQIQKPLPCLTDSEAASFSEVQTQTPSHCGRLLLEGPEATPSSLAALAGSRSPSRAVWTMPERQVDALGR
eukprot:4138748-Alexandrium_andersonii.AAC.1